MKRTAIVIHKPAPLGNFSTVIVNVRAGRGICAQDQTLDERDFTGPSHRVAALRFALLTASAKSEVVVVDKVRIRELRRRVETAASNVEAAYAFKRFLVEHPDLPGTSGKNEPSIQALNGRIDVLWESGPFEWALDFASGQLISSSALGRPAPSPFNREALDQSPWRAEPYSGSVLSFYPAS